MLYFEKPPGRGHPTASMVIAAVVVLTWLVYFGLGRSKRLERAALEPPTAAKAVADKTE